MATKRAIKDAQLIEAKALPAAGATNQSPTIDLGAGGYVPESVEVEISIPAMSAHSDTAKDVVITLQDSANDSSYADVDPLIQVTRPGIASTGTSAETIRFRLPANTRRYIQFTQAVDSGGPTLTAKSITYSLLF